MTNDELDRLAAELQSEFLPGPYVAIIGSTRLWDSNSPLLCELVGEYLAQFPRIGLLTGGMPGVGEAVGRSFFKTRTKGQANANVYHVLPAGSANWDYGITLFAGSDFEERREVLGRLANVYVMIEGGPGTEHEARVAHSRGAVVIPIARSGGCAAQWHREAQRPEICEKGAWESLAAEDSSIEELARTAVELVANIHHLN